jgi:hypothetical protein
MCKWWVCSLPDQYIVVPHELEHWSVRAEDHHMRHQKLIKLSFLGENRQSLMV